MNPVTTKASEIERIERELKDAGYPLFLTRIETATLLREDPLTTWRRMQRRELPYLQDRAGGRIRVSRRALAEYMARLAV